MKFINEEFKYNNLDWEKRTKIFNIFKASYEEAVGTSWSEDKFRNRASNWLFFGDENGFVTVRPQQSGFYKLTGVAGGIKSIMKGLAELKAANLPIWGMATKELTNILVGRYGYKIPNKIESMVLMKLIPKNVFGNIEYKKNSDGSITFQYPDVGESTKFFVGNDAYYKKIRKEFGAKLNPFNLLKEDGEVLDEKRAVDVQHESSMDIVRSYVQKYGLENVYISFRETVNTSTINPRNRYGTPTGFYAYPIKYYVENRGLDLNTITWENYIQTFPFAGEREFVNIFTILDGSTILYSSQDNSSKIQHYIEQIKLKYGTLTTYVDPHPDDDNSQSVLMTVTQICDQFLAGEWKSTYSDDDGNANNMSGNQMAQFWLFLYHIAALIRAGGRLQNKVAIIAREIGLLGICDDAGLGIIHTNERAQIVLFYGFMNIVSNYRILSSKTQRQDQPLPIDVKQGDRESNNTTPTEKIAKFIKHLGAKMGIPDDYIRLPYDYYNDVDANKTVLAIKDNKPFPVKIRKEVDGVYRFFPFYIDRNGKIGSGDIAYNTMNDYDDNIYTDRAAYYNSQNPDKPKFISIQNKTYNGLVRARMYTADGNYLDTFINDKGEQELPANFDFENEGRDNILVYLNTLAGYNKWRRVSEFDMNKGEFGIGWLSNTAFYEYPFVVNKEGNIPENGFGIEMHGGMSYNAICAQINSVLKTGKLSGDNIHSFNFDNGGLLTVSYRSNVRNANFYVYFDLLGHPSVEGLTPETLAGGAPLAGYYNTLMGIEFYRDVQRQSAEGITYLASTIQFLIHYFDEGEDKAVNAIYIDKTTGEPSLEGIVDDTENPYSNQEAYQNTKKVIELGYTIKKLNASVPINGIEAPKLAMNESKKSLLKIINEAIKSFLI